MAILDPQADEPVERPCAEEIAEREAERSVDERWRAQRGCCAHCGDYLRASGTTEVPGDHALVHAQCYNAYEDAQEVKR